MILTAPEILSEVHNGSIIIDPFDERQLNPNSYNYRLGSSILETDDPLLDVRSTPHWRAVSLPTDGLTLQPRRLYLSNTLERIGSSQHVTSLIGRSSLGRLGMFLQVTADLGHTGAIHNWTLELHVVQPLRIYPGMSIGQVTFWRTRGDESLYDGRYAMYSEPTPNLIDREESGS